MVLEQSVPMTWWFLAHKSSRDSLVEIIHLRKELTRLGTWSQGSWGPSQKTLRPWKHSHCSTSWCILGLPHAWRLTKHLNKKGGLLVSFPCTLNPLWTPLVLPAPQEEQLWQPRSCEGEAALHTAKSTMSPEPSLLRHVNGGSDVSQPWALPVSTSSPCSLLLFWKSYPLTGKKNAGFIKGEGMYQCQKAAKGWIHCSERQGGWGNCSWMCPYPGQKELMPGGAGKEWCLFGS